MSRRRLVTGVAALEFTLLGVGAASAIPIGDVSVGAVANAAQGTRVGDSAEAWYFTASELCLPLIGCVSSPVALPGLYPAGTLHVGVTSGVGSARTYLVPDVAAAAKHGPAKQLYEGTLVLPVDSSLLAGTMAVGSAHIKACLVTGKLPTKPSTTGSTAGAKPAIDCRTSAAATYAAATKTFTVDLSRFLAKWHGGVPNRGVALIPVVAPGATWQVTFDGKKASGATVYSLISAAHCHGCGLPLPLAAPTPSSTPTDAGAPPSFVGPATPGDEGVAPLPVAPPQVAPSAQSAVYLVREGRYRYPAVFLAPLAILAGVIFFGRLFTGQAGSPRAGASRNRARS